MQICGVFCCLDAWQFAARFLTGTASSFSISMSQYEACSLLCWLDSELCSSIIRSCVHVLNSDGMTFVSSCNSTSIASSSKPHRSARHAHAHANNFWFAAEVTAVVLMECTPRGTYNKTPMALQQMSLQCWRLCLSICLPGVVLSLGRRRRSC